MRNWSIIDQSEKWEIDQHEATKDQGYRERMQEMRGRSRKEDSVCISKRGRHDTKKKIWNEHAMTTSFLFGIQI